MMEVPYKHETKHKAPQTVKQTWLDLCISEIISLSNNWKNIYWDSIFFFLWMQERNTIISSLTSLFQPQTLLLKKNTLERMCDDATADQGNEMIFYIIHHVLNPAASTGLDDSWRNRFDL